MATASDKLLEFYQLLEQAIPNNGGVTVRGFMDKRVLDGVVVSAATNGGIRHFLLERFQFGPTNPLNKVRLGELTFTAKKGTTSLTVPTVGKFVPYSVPKHVHTPTEMYRWIVLAMTGSVTDYLLGTMGFDYSSHESVSPADEGYIVPGDGSLPQL